jgi:Ca-activated chloride channel family protein
MNASNDNHDPTTIDALHDRLVDRALAELIGHDAPPDLSARILKEPAATPLKLQTAAGSGRARRRPWLALAVAAVLLVGVSIALILPDAANMREAAGPRESANSLRSIKLQNHADSGALLSQLATTTPANEEQSKWKEVAELDSSAPTITARTESRSWDKDQLSLLTSQTHGVGYGDEASAPAPPAEMPDDGLGDGVASSNNSLFAFSDEAALLNESQIGGRRKEKELRELSRPVRVGQRWRIDAETAEGMGPGLSGDQYVRIVENPFIKAERGAAVSTFSIDVDTASYANVRQFLLEMNTLPPPDAVRLEELINYFEYDYAGPPSATGIPPAEPGAGDKPVANADADNTPSAPGSAGGLDGDAPPFAAHVEVAGCPWAADHRLVRIGIKGREMDRDKRPRSNLVFLVDVSGSMDEPNKLPLVVYGLQQLTRELGENDRVAIVVYASSEGLVLPSTPGSNQREILDALGKLSAGGSTAGGAGIQLAYQIAEDNFIEGGTNRVILCTDGDFNVGVTSTAELERLCEQKAKDTRVFLSVLGFGRGNLNDAMMEAISNHGNGNYHYVDNRTEARRVLVEEMTGTLVTIAKDVKIQVEFNPVKVAGYRLLGYENRMLRTEDFNDDKKDAGEIGAGHTVTALYEVVPTGKPVDVAAVDDLKYQRPAADPSRSRLGDDDKDANAADISNELLTLKMRYKPPQGDASRKLEWPVTDDGKSFSAAGGDYQFAAAVAGFGMLLRDSQYKGNLTYAAVLELAQAGIGEDKHGYRSEFLDMVRQAKSLKGE